MHIIREEMEEQAEEEAYGLGTKPEVHTSPVTSGGLSRALGNPIGSSSSRLLNRSFSLHSLLDQSMSGIGTESPGAASGTNISDTTDGRSPTTQPLGEIDRKDSRKSTSSSLPPWEGKQNVIDGLNDLIDELKDIDTAIAAHAPEHIHTNEVILTFGYSRTVLKFLKRGREKRDFQAVVAEGAPGLEGHKMAAELSAAGIRTTLITDAAVFAMMARVNKVIISAHAILADGGVMAPAGTSMVASAAKRHSVPFVLLVGIYKLSPNFPHEPGVSFNDFKEPSDVLPYSDPAVLEAETIGKLHANETLKLLFTLDFL